MKVAIEARALSNHGGGVNRYVRNLLLRLGQQRGEIDCYPLYDAKPALKLGIGQARVIKRYGDIGLWYWLNYQINPVLEEVLADVVHFTKADVPAKKTRPTVVTIYDVIPLLFPAGQTYARRWYWPRALRRAVAQSDHIITISAASKRDISERLEIDGSKITVTPLGVDDKLAARTAAGASKLAQRPGQKPYILFVGTIEPRKNIGALLRAFAAISHDLPHQLIIAGRAAWGGKELRMLARQLRLEDRVEWRGFVTDEELGRLYDSASLFVWPSIYEGWGFPPQEAMARQVPVIVSDGGALPEVVGDGGEIVRYHTANIKERLCDAAFVADLSTRILAVACDRSRQLDLIRRGRERADEFSWEQVAERTIGVYKMVSS